MSQLFQFPEGTPLLLRRQLDGRTPNTKECKTVERFFLLINIGNSEYKRPLREKID